MTTTISTRHVKNNVIETLLLSEKTLRTDWNRSQGDDTRKSLDLPAIESFVVKLTNTSKSKAFIEN